MNGLSGIGGLILLSLVIGGIVIFFALGRALTMWFFGTEELIAHQKKTNELLQRIIELASDDTKETAAVQLSPVQPRPVARNPLVSR